MESYDGIEMDENKKYMQLNSMIGLVQKYGKEEFSKLDSFLSKDCINYHKEKTRIYKEHDIDNAERFNFFESISDKWYRENFHSDILYTILNPDTKEIGRKFFMEEFVKFLNIEDRFDCNKDCEVIKECPTGFISWKDNNEDETGQEGYIDLLIKNDTQAIIIENKIHYAPDMENQLVRYMKYVDEELCIKEYTVVYLTLTGDKEPPLDSYSKDFDEYAKKLHDEKNLKKVCAVNEKHGLANVFLKNCCKRLEEEMANTNDPELKKKCNIASVYIDQYKTLLEHLGGRAYMLSTEKKLIEEIYSNSDNLKAAEDFSEFWNRKTVILDEIFKERFREKFPDRNLPSKVNINGLPFYIWEVEGKDYFLYWDGGVYMGFCSQNGKQLSDETQNKLLKQICRIPLREGEYKENTWVYCNIKSDSENPNLFENVMNALEILFNS